MNDQVIDQKVKAPDKVSTVGKIVIVDDNPENLRTLKTILDSCGYETHPAISGKLALNSIKKVNPDIVLLDIMMPHMNGYEVCEHLKADATTKEIPVLFISALDESVDKVKAFDVGGVDYISKPFQAEEVLARVKTHISLSCAQKQLEEHARQLEATNKELEAFSYSVSHDLRSPLRSISGFSEILLDDFSDQLNNEGKEYLQKICQSTKKMSDLITGLLALSRFGKSEINITKLDLNKMIEKIIADFNAQYPDKPHHIVVKPNLSARGDRKLVGIVLDNLINNAWKYSSKKDKIEIEIGTRDDNPNVFYIKDNGVGFDMQYVDKVFKPFQRLHKTDEFEGIGIGLATVSRIIHRHGGDIWAESIPETGTIFYFSFGTY